ncbi:MAG TPA: SCO family protein [Chthoniobacterales bacterium]|nr:SCO family protein [Chthoniobacterales bacterium]
MHRHAFTFSVRHRLLAGVFLVSLALPLPAAPPEPETQAPRRTEVPDTELVNQNGEKLHLYSDLVKGRVVAISFIFTTCPTICNTIGIHLGQLQKELGPVLGRDAGLISISIDPTTDTPEKLRAWGERFDAAPGWTLLTGGKDSVTQLLKKLEVYVPNIQSHSPFLLIVNDRTGSWQRVNALEVPPVRIAALLREEVNKAGGAAPRSVSTSGSTTLPIGNTPAQRYFTDVELTNQDGKRLRLYSDLLRGKVVVIGSFFSSCTSVCKVTMPMFHSLQERFAERPGPKPHFISISVDPETDTPAVLRKYARGLEAKEGWDFLTGDKQSVDLALQKLGFATEMREGHSNVFIVGNETTGLWKKVLGIGASEEIAAAVESVLADAP